METDQENRVQENLTDQTDRGMAIDQANQIVRVTDIDLEGGNRHTGNLYMADLDMDMVIIRIIIITIITMVDTILTVDGTGQLGTVAFGAAAGLALGSIVYALDDDCTTVIRNGRDYRICDGIYYEPFYEGGELHYRVVSAP